MKKSVWLIIAFIILLIPVVIAQLQQPGPATEPLTTEAVETEAVETEVVDAEPADTEEPEQPPETEVDLGELGAAATAVDLLAACVDSGSPESDAFDYQGIDVHTRPPSRQTFCLYSPRTVYGSKALRLAQAVTSAITRLLITRWTSPPTKVS